MDVVVRTDRGVNLASPTTGTLYEGKAGSVHDDKDPLIYFDGPEYRTLDEVESIVEQLPGKPFTLLHPSDGLVSEGAKADIIGRVVSARVDNGYAVATIMVTDERGREAIAQGTFALSLGYRCVLDSKRYQRKIQIDHLALVPKGRCQTCELRADASKCIHGLDTEETTMEIGTHTIKVDVQLTDTAKETLKTLENAEAFQRVLSDAMSAMSKVNCDNCDAMYEKGTSHTCAPKTDHEGSSGECTCKNRAMSHTSGETTMADTELQGKLDAALAEIASLKEKVTTLEVEATNARKDADVLKGQVEAAQALASKAKEDAEAEVNKAKTDAADALANELNARVDARVALLLEASKVLKDQDLKALSDRDIKIAVIKHVDGDDVPAEKSNDYVAGVYEGALKRAGSASASRETVRTTLNDMRKDSAPVLKGADLEKAAKEQMHRESAQAWTK